MTRAYMCREFFCIIIVVIINVKGTWKKIVLVLEIVRHMKMHIDLMNGQHVLDKIKFRGCQRKFDQVFKFSIVKTNQ